VKHVTGGTLLYGRSQSLYDLTRNELLSSAASKESIRSDRMWQQRGVIRRRMAVRHCARQRATSAR